MAGEELLYRQPPHSVEAEQSVLGSMLINSKCIPAVVEALKPDDFYLEQNQTLFDTMYAMFSHAEVIDPVTVLEQMRRSGTYAEGTTRNIVGAFPACGLDFEPGTLSISPKVAIITSSR